MLKNKVTVNTCFITQTSYNPLNLLVMSLSEVCHFMLALKPPCIWYRCTFFGAWAVFNKVFFLPGFPSELQEPIRHCLTALSCLCLSLKGLVALTMLFFNFRKWNIQQQPLNNGNSTLCNKIPIQFQTETRNLSSWTTSCSFQARVTQDKRTAWAPLCFYFSFLKEHSVSLNVYFLS